ncbi:crotonase/enoyl-CoA hydratase family protein [Litoribrevibacter euphylliae]|uniref:Crotonase/enoyl-CoA hydratase family protein n=1 Tax=Litoribrevibacter euphylliae TaxID=1834034 RepID=A0ABV7HKL7_9GAMM
MKEVNAGAGRVTREIKDHVFLIGLDRAGKRNAFDSHMMLDLSLALGEYERNDDLRCAVIFAEGEHFTSGLDLMELTPKLMSGSFQYPEEGIDPWATTSRVTKPLIVAVQGMCWTAGIELMLTADIALAANDTRYAHVEVLRGIPPSAGSTVRFPKAAGWSDAMKYMLTGEEFNAEEALNMKLISEVVAPEALRERAIELAEKIAKAAPLAIKATLASARQAASDNEETALASLNDHLFGLLKSKDVQEGVMAMMQKREPVFKGC